MLQVELPVRIQSQVLVRRTWALHPNNSITSDGRLRINDASTCSGAITILHNNWWDPPKVFKTKIQGIR